MLRPCACLLFFLFACGSDERTPVPEFSEPTADPGGTTPSAECPADGQAEDPSTWFASGENPSGYEMKADPALARCGEPGLAIRSLAGAPPDRFGTFMTKRPAEEFHGKRIELRATVKTVNVTGWAALWLRVDGPGGILAFDNMQKRPIKGTTDFASYSVVLDVADTARELAFGVLLHGQGELSGMDVEIRVVPPTVPTTARAR